MLIRWIFTPSSANKFTSLRRLIAIATWSDPTGPECYANISFRSEKLKEKIKKWNE